MATGVRIHCRHAGLRRFSCSLRTGSDYRSPHWTRYLDVQALHRQSWPHSCGLGTGEHIPMTLLAGRKVDVAGTLMVTLRSVVITRQRTPGCVRISGCCRPPGVERELAWFLTGCLRDPWFVLVLVRFGRGHSLGLLETLRENQTVTAPASPHAQPCRIEAGNNGGNFLDEDAAYGRFWRDSRQATGSGCPSSDNTTTLLRCSRRHRLHPAAGRPTGRAGFPEGPHADTAGSDRSALCRR